MAVTSVGVFHFYTRRLLTLILILVLKVIVIASRLTGRVSVVLSVKGELLALIEVFLLLLLLSCVLLSAVSLPFLVDDCL